MISLCLKQVVKKLAGSGAGTAAWATDVGNGCGQVLTCVLTAAEGSGLVDMAAGLVRRYELGGQQPPVLTVTVVPTPSLNCCTME